MIAGFKLCLAVLGTVAAASPALANSAASADIATPLRAAEAQRADAAPQGDKEFSQLFASWRAMDGGQNPGFATARGPSDEAVGMGARLGQIAAVPSLVPIDSPRLTSGFGMRWHPVLGGRHEHKGVDLAAPIGTPVHAAADGMVERADWFSGYGLYVALEHGNAVETRYGHMSRLAVAAGQMVHKGDVIGYVGMTGRTTGPHLHYEVRLAGEAVNPMPYLQGAGAPMLDTATRLAEAKEPDTGDDE